MGNVKSEGDFTVVKIYLECMKSFRKCAGHPLERRLKDARQIIVEGSYSFVIFPFILIPRGYATFQNKSN